MGNEITEHALKFGEPFEVEFTFTVNGVVEPITGFDAKIQLRAEKESGSLVYEWVDGDAELSRDNNAGIVRLIIKPSTTYSFKFRIGFFDLLLKQPQDVDGIRSDLQIIKPHRGVTNP